MQELAGLLPLVAIGLLFYLLMIRPQARRQREVRQMQSTLNLGDQVMLTSGIYGEVRSLDDDRVRVEIAHDVVVEVARGAVGQRRAPPVSEDTSESTGTSADDTTGER